MMHAAILMMGLSVGAGPKVKPNDVPQAEIERLAELGGASKVESFVKFAEGCEERRQPYLDKKKQELRELKLKISKAPRSEKKAIKEELDKQQELYEIIESRKAVVIPDLSESLRLKTVGQLPSGYTVLDVISDGIIRAELSFDGTDVDVILKGVDTKGLADGKVIYDGRSFRVTGNQNYTTVLGATRTVMVLEPFNSDPVAEYLQLRYGKKKPAAKK